uniref:Uncharacterized protein n=1 Tax=Astatotilapia calliptera TaxID=8154 RepID=A0A3P8PLE6_ASTCA
SADLKLSKVSTCQDIRTKLSGRVTTLPSLGRRPKPLHSAGMKLVSMLRNNPETTKVQLWHEQESAVILGKKNPATKSTLSIKETMIELFGHNGKRYACLGMFKPEAFKPKNTVSDIKHGGGSTSVVHGIFIFLSCIS